MSYKLLDLGLLDFRYSISTLASQIGAFGGIGLETDTAFSMCLTIGLEDILMSDAVSHIDEITDLCTSILRYANLSQQDNFAIYLATSAGDGKLEFKLF